MNLLIIGSDSFIAKNFISQYSNKFNLTCISRFVTDNDSEIVIPDLHQIPVDIFKGKIAVLNFAAIVHKPRVKDENIYDSVNFLLTLYNAQKSKRAGVKMFIQVSSISIYGNTRKISIETAPNPQNPYGKSKLKADEGLLKLQDEKFKIAIIRPPMVYGGGNAPGNMLKLIRLADKMIPLPFKNIDNKRDYININNLVQYLALTAENLISGVYLVSDNESVSTIYLLNTIYKYLKKRGIIIKVPYFILEIFKNLWPLHYSKLFGTFHIETNFPCENSVHRYSVEDGIREMVEWYKNKATSSSSI
jgi:UDP-glucose 4-epimerase